MYHILCVSTVESLEYEYRLYNVVSILVEYVGLCVFMTTTDRACLSVSRWRERQRGWVGELGVIAQY